MAADRVAVGVLQFWLAHNLWLDIASIGSGVVIGSRRLARARPAASSALNPGPDSLRLTAGAQ